MEKNIEFNLDGEYIELIKLLKYTGIAESGGQAKSLVEQGLVKRDGAPEAKKRAKIRRGDSIVFNNLIHIVVI